MRECKLDTINLMVTGRCNAACPCCYQRASSQEPSLDSIRKLCEQASELGLKRVMLSGGEPLLRDDICEIISIVRRCNAQVVLSTNGYLVTAELARALRQAGTSTISLSIDFPTKEGHDRDPSIAPSIESAARILVENGLRVVANVIVTHSNISHINRISRLIRKFGIENLNFLRPKPSTTTGWFERARLSKKDLYRLQLKKVSMVYSDFKDITFDCALCPLLYGAPESFLRNEGITGCGAGIDFLTVTEAGDIYPCPDLKRPEFWLGNIENDSLVKIWREHQFLAKLRETSQLRGGCKTCKLASVCRGCRSMALFIKNDLFAEDPDCPYLKRNILFRAAMLIPVYAGIILYAITPKKKKRVLEPEGMTTPEEVEAYEILTRDHRTYDDEVIANKVMAMIPENQPIRLLDVGCGTARIDMRILRGRPNVCITAVDLSLGMLEQAKKNVIAETQLAEQKRITFMQADGKCLPFANEEFDFGFCCYTLHHLKQPELMIREIARVTKPEGGLFFFDLQRRGGKLLELWVRIFTMGYPLMVRKLYRDSLRASLSLKEFKRVIISANIPGLRMGRRSIFDFIAIRDYSTK